MIVAAEKVWWALVPQVYIFTDKHHGKTGHVFGLACATRNRGRKQPKRELEGKTKQKLALSWKKTDAVAVVPKTFPRLEV